MSLVDKIRKGLADGQLDCRELNEVRQAVKAASVQEMKDAYHLLETHACSNNLQCDGSSGLIRYYLEVEDLKRKPGATEEKVIVAVEKNAGLKGLLKSSNVFLWDCASKDAEQRVHDDGISVR